MPTSAPRTDHIAACAREAAGIVLAHPLALHLSAISVDTLIDLAHRSDGESVTLEESAWLLACVATVITVEADLGREARP